MQYLYFIVFNNYTEKDNAEILSFFVTKLLKLKRHRQKHWLEDWFHYLFIRKCNYAIGTAVFSTLQREKQWYTLLSHICITPHQ